MTPFVTVAIPVSAAHVQYLPAALDSVRAQTAWGFIGQIIVVNDSGQDISLSGERLRLLATRGKQGAAVARNIAIEQTQTPFIVCLDADDLLVNTAVETMLRAYATYPNAAYIYGDAWTDSGDAKGLLYYVAPIYDRKLLLNERNIHNVTTLLPVSVARAVGGFDEVTRGWEDWDFYIRLAIAGYCGVKVPSPFIVYRLHTGANRQYSGTIANDLIREERERYAYYLEGRKLLMACCGQDANLSAQLLGSLPPDAQGQGDVLLEFTGEQRGTVAFRGPSGTMYRGANDPQEKFARVKRVDVENLIGRGVWRLVPEVAMRALQPNPADVIQARRKAEPVGVTIPRMETAQSLAAQTTIVTAKACIHCGHIQNFDSPDGCQALLASGKVCGCRTFESEAKPEQDKRNGNRGRAATRTRQNKRNTGVAA